MQWLYKLERKYGRFCISNLLAYITLTMACVFIMDNVIGVPISQWLYLSRDLVFAGQIWRLLTFIFVPPGGSILTIFFVLYFYYFIGSGLENAWGTFQFNVYYLFGVMGAIVAALISGRGDNMYLNLSLFLAFAQLFPDEQVLLFFILPIKIKYLAYVDWALFALGLLLFSWPARAAIIASLINFFIFFGPGFIKRYRNNRKYSAVRRNWKKQMRQRDQRW